VLATDRLPSLIGRRTPHRGCVRCVRAPAAGEAFRETSGTTPDAISARRRRARRGVPPRGEGCAAATGMPQAIEIGGVSS